MRKSEFKTKLQAILYWNRNASDETKAAAVMQLIDDEKLLPPLAKLDKLDGYDNYWEPEDEVSIQTNSGK